MRTFTGIPRVIVAVWAAAMLAGCLGPTAIQSARTQYNEAIQDTSNEQLLLNLVRLRYRESMTFLEVGGVTANYTLTIGATPSWSTTGGKDAAGTKTLTLSGEYSENPTITYEPIQGEQFANRIISEVDKTTVFAMMQGGWHVDEFLRLTVDRMGGYWNDPRTLRSADDEDCDFKQFRKICSALRILQDHHALNLSLEKDPGPEIHVSRDNAGCVDSLLTAESQGFCLVDSKTTDKEYVIRKDGPPFLTMAISHDPKDLDREAAAASLFETLLKTKESVPSDWKLRFDIPSSGGYAKRPEASSTYVVVPIKFRSFETIMYLLSQGIPVPQSDARYVKAHYYSGISAEDRTPDNEMQWAKTVGLINVKCSSARPSHALVAVCYHGAWFYVDQVQSERIGRTTVESKDTLTMLSYIYSLQTGEIKAAAPLLTIPTR